MTMLRAGGLLDVLTPLSDSRQEAVENVERRTENFGGWIYLLDGFPRGGFVLWVLYARLISFHSCRLSIFRLPRQGLPRPIYTAQATTPLPPLHSLYISRLPRQGLPRQGLPRPILTTTGYHACVFIPVITPELSRSTIPRTSGYHTRHSSYFIIYLSLAFTPPLHLLLHHHRAPHATTYSTLRTSPHRTWKCGCSP